MIRSILAECLRLLDERVPFALATVVSTRGSVPAKPGARMIVRSNGATSGTVGGAGLERQVIERAMECIRTGEGGLYPFTLWHRSPGGLDSLCGGTVDIQIEYMRPPAHLLICGGGHVGKALAEMSGPLEYFHSVYDVRPEYASAERFPAARARHTGPSAAFVRRFVPVATTATEPGASPPPETPPARDEWSHIVVCGHSYHVDLDLLQAMAPAYEGWIGVIASAAKRREMFAELTARGVAPDRLERIECPVGLAIGAVTPAEIAVSILAGIVKSRNLR